MAHDVKYDYSKLLGRIKEFRSTQERLSAEIGMSESTLSLKLNSNAFFRQNEIRKICDFLNIDTAEIGAYFFTLEVQEN